jgi:hypothetical protein
LEEIMPTSPTITTRFGATSLTEEAARDPRSVAAQLRGHGDGREKIFDATATRLTARNVEPDMIAVAYREFLREQCVQNVELSSCLGKLRLWLAVRKAMKMQRNGNSVTQVQTSKGRFKGVFAK